LIKRDVVIVDQLSQRSFIARPRSAKKTETTTPKEKAHHVEGVSSKGRE
jgi:hypothetical protein